MGAYAMTFVLKSENNLFGSQFSLHHVGLSVKRQVIRLVGKSHPARLQH